MQQPKLKQKSVINKMNCKQLFKNEKRFLGEDENFDGETASLDKTPVNYWLSKKLNSKHSRLRHSISG